MGRATPVNRLVVDHATLRLPPERAGTDPVRVALLSDIQFKRVGDTSARRSCS